MSPAPVLLVAGATGALGNEMLRRLVGTQRFSQTHVLAREPMRAGMTGVHLVPVAAAGTSHSPLGSWPPVPADVAVVMFDPPRPYYDRERALWTPAPHELPALARWLRTCGVSTLAVVLPHDEGRLPEALKHGLANVDEHDVASLDFERVLLVRSARKPQALKRASAPERLAHWMLSIFQFMVPVAEQPVRASKVAELVDLALRMAPPGVHVAGPLTVWQAGQGGANGLQAALRQWLHPEAQSTAKSGG
jgi:hypothetical protein